MKHRTPTREDELAQAIIPIVNAGVSVFALYKLMAKSNAFLRMDTFDRLQGVLETFYGPVDWTQYDGSYQHPPCPKDPKKKGDHNWKCPPGKQITRCQFCGIRKE